MQKQMLGAQEALAVGDSAGTFVIRNLEPRMPDVDSWWRSRFVGPALHGTTCMSSK